jgi:uncharacterized membrane protein
MLELLRSIISDPSLPNLHAAVVHLPVGLLPTALLLDLATLVFRRRMWLERAAASLYVIGTIGAAAAYLTGQRASESMWTFSGEAQAVMADHEDLALLTLVSFSLITLLRIVASWLSRRDLVVPIGFVRLTAMIGAVAGMVLLLVTADHGGRLVYRHGMGVETPPSADSTAPGTPTESS